MMPRYNILFVLQLFVSLTVFQSVIAVDLPHEIWSHIEYGFTHDRPSLPTNISDYNTDFIIDYSSTLIPFILVPVGISILTVIVGIIYAIIRCCCACCSSNNNDDDDIDDDDINDDVEDSRKKIPNLYPKLSPYATINDVHRSKHKTYSTTKRVVPSVFYVIFVLGVVGACVLGYLGNTHFTNGVGELQTSVEGVGTDTLNLADNLTVSLTGVANQATDNLDDLSAQLSGLPSLSTRVVQLESDVNNTQQQVSDISAQVKNISSSVNLTVLQEMIQNMDDITDESSIILGNITSLIGKLDVVSNTTFDDITARINEAIDDVNDAVNQSTQYINTTKDVINTVHDYNTKITLYNDKRDLGYEIWYAVILGVCLFAAIGFCIKKSFSFHTTAAFGFIFCFFLWIIAGVHVVVWIAIDDVCPVIDPLLKSIQIGNETEFSNAIQGCLTGNQTIFQSLDLHDTINFTMLHQYQADFTNLTNFVNTYNFTEIDGYLDEINSLYVYNLTGIAANLTVETFGWDPNVVYEGLDRLNSETSPHGYTYSLQNYTNLNLNDFPVNERSRINDTKTALDNLVLANATVYDELAQAQLQLNDAQDSINTLIDEMNVYTQQYYALKADVLAFSSQNASKAINITEDMEQLVLNLDSLGECGFVGERYHELLNALCSTVKPSLLWLMISMIVLSVCIIAVIVLVEVLAARMPYPERKRGYVTLPDGGDNAISFTHVAPKYNPKKNSELSPSWWDDNNNQNSTNSRPPYNPASSSLPPYTPSPSTTSYQNQNNRW